MAGMFGKMPLIARVKPPVVAAWLDRTMRPSRQYTATAPQGRNYTGKEVKKHPSNILKQLGKFARIMIFSRMFLLQKLSPY
ncbi:hypothetical protein [Burkholderia oklahomensis]|uniref:hypothetical protein n=1 Tax=Burkholderia oklahomensis TaxID=342113 RepID=UPI000AF669AE|nr:hypothetical protein [Burkholderia oklahomensis]